MNFSMVARWFCLSTLALLVTLSSHYEYGVNAITFSFNGFKGLYDVYTVEQDYQVWTYNSVNYSITLTPSDFYYTSIAGRFLYPTPVQMTDTLHPTTVKSFSTTFIFQILITGTLLGVGPGLAFIMVPDNITIGAKSDYMGLLTAVTTDTNKTYASDDHTVGVELDTHMNVEFNDPNENHVCIDVASMNSTENNTFIPNIPLATENPKRFQQLWIDYDQADSRMTIYHAQYGQAKPTTPLGSQVTDMSIMKEYMYVGFSTASGYESSNLHTILAWSFSNEGEAPEIRIGQDVGSLPPASPPPPPTPTAPTPNMSPPSGPVPTPVSPPPSVPPLRSPPPPIVFPPVSSATPVGSNPPPPGAPGSPSPSNTPPPIFSPIPGPKPAPSGISGTIAVEIAVGVVAFIVSTAVIVFMLFKYRPHRQKSDLNTSLEKGMNGQPSQELPVRVPTVLANPKFHIFISHTSGKGGSKKNFPIGLYEELKQNPCYEVFIDRYELTLGIPFPEEIMQEIQKCVGIGVGIMVVTEEFFQKSWPMIELVEFLKLQKENGTSQVRILPLFYELEPDEIRRRLDTKVWDAGWLKMSTESHPVDVREYRDAVAKLCTINGVKYRYSDWSFEAEYKQEILEKVKKMYEKMHVVS